MRNWYVDGRIYYHKVIDLEKPQEGIKEVRYIDPMKIKLVRKIKKDAKTAINPSFSVSGTQNGTGSFATPEVEEFYEYNPNTRQCDQYFPIQIGNGRGQELQRMRLLMYTLVL